MQHCENCGSSNEPGAIFCEACGTSLTKLPSSSFEYETLQMKKKIDFFNENLDEKMGSLSKKKSLDSPGIKNYLLIILGGTLIIIGLASLTTDFPSFPSLSSFPSFPAFPRFSQSIIIPIGFTFLALLLVFLIARNSTKDPLIFVAIAVGIITIGLSIAIPGSSAINMPIGFTIVFIIISIVIYRYFKLDSLVLAGMIVFLIVFGLIILIPGSSAIIFPIGLVLIGFLTCGMALKSNFKFYSRTKKQLSR